ncbi:uncharacterized protein (TIGR03032 family) [Methylopila capsulata]|uniref:TIGR03032 family protein n=1 Tax=Methylopila capsulata TaxID=61654 RepID=A0A9W6IT00_9HYPH|nr:TIGR03032 family protein [Methylopila capsulata]MBM7850687.1 uncharacterized protein (TIGR03032 family) [Methylopila capsulata]GLK55982.1 TIGR03032 family protein [Methylopila capsulata]
MTDSPAEPFAVSTSPGFAAWLARAKVSLAFSTYQAGKLLLLGVRPDGRLSVFERSFKRSMGIAVAPGGRSFALATHNQILRFDDVLPRGQRKDGHDAVYAPHAGWITGASDSHDVGFGPRLRPIFVNTRFSCLAAVSDGHSFKPVWRPPFVTALQPEDRCHLNGLAMRGETPAYVTIVGRSDAPHGWREMRGDGGLVMDVATSKTVVEGLSMPHSPRLVDGRLWLLNSGRGEFGFVDVAARRFEPLAFCPGYARGLAIVGRHAVVGLSLARENKTFGGLALEQELAQRGEEPRCGLLVIDVKTGETVEWVRLAGPVRELYDVAALPAVANPSLVGLFGDDVDHVVSIEGR